VLPVHLPGHIEPVDVNRPGLEGVGRLFALVRSTSRFVARAFRRALGRPAEAFARRTTRSRSCVSVLKRPRSPARRSIVA
jgi:hypothetical protein